MRNDNITLAMAIQRLRLDSPPTVYTACKKELHGNGSFHTGSGAGTCSVLLVKPRP